MDKPLVKKWLRLILAFVLGGLAIVYTMFPADIIPDITPIFGILDDLGFDIIAVINFIKRVDISDKYKN